MMRRLPESAAAMRMLLVGAIVAAAVAGGVAVAGWPAWGPLVAVVPLLTLAVVAAMRLSRIDRRDHPDDPAWSLGWRSARWQRILLTVGVAWTVVPVPLTLLLTGEVDAFDWTRTAIAAAIAVVAGLRLRVLVRRGGDWR